MFCYKIVLKYINYNGYTLKRKSECVVIFLFINVFLFWFIFDVCLFDLLLAVEIIYAGTSKNCFMFVNSTYFLVSVNSCYYILYQCLSTRLRFLISGSWYKLVLCSFLSGWTPTITAENLLEILMCSRIWLVRFGDLMPPIIISATWLAVVVSLVSCSCLVC